MGAAIDPQLLPFIEGIAAAWARHPALDTLSPVEARKVAEAVRAPWTKGGPQMAATRELAVPAGAGSVRIRAHLPSTGKALPALIYAHGGGWTIFSLDTHDRLMREYAAEAGIAVVGVDYSLSPEAKFPRAIEETAAVVRWLAGHGTQLGIDGARLALGGDSAGAHISAAAALMLRDAGAGGLLAGLVLNYGTFDDDFSQPSYRSYGGGEYTLSRDEMVTFWEQHLPQDRAVAEPLARPLRARLAGLPPALLVVTELDPLHDDSMAMAAALDAAGVEAEARVYPGTTHGFLEAMSVADVSRRAIAETARWLAGRLGSGRDV